MTDKKKTESVGRRDVLRLGVIGAVAAGAATLAGTDEAAASDVDAGKSGYRETAHVKKFYELARF